MRNVRQIWEETSKQLQKVHEKRESEHIAYLLLEDHFRVFKTDILLEEMREVDQNKLDVLTKRLLAGEPIQYITGRTEFYAREFQVYPGVLIPRPETEELVDLILRENTLSLPTILDIGVGSGCIAITLALETAGTVYGSDISMEALQIAERNAEHLIASVKFLHHDILKEDIPLGDLDIIVSNPPYIPLSDKQQMHANVLGFEPEIALFVSDDDPFVFYREVAIKSAMKLRNGGKLYFEIHERYGKEIQQLVEQIGYTDVCIHQDMQGKDRMISATNSTNR